jgi:hypothetical protein
MQLVFIGLIGVGAAVVVGLMGPLAIKAGRALQERLNSGHVHVGDFERVRH